MGDRLTQDGVNYTLDLNAEFTQVLDDGTNSYLYGLGRIAEREGSTSEYYLGDALGSVRQITNGGGTVTLARDYDPFGVLAQTIGTAQTDIGFTGEFSDASGLIYLRARYYAPEMGRFLTRDTWAGDVNSPQSLNRWNYVQSNPILYSDPTGHSKYKSYVDWVDKNVNIPKTEWLNTYTAAGIAVQFWAQSLDLLAILTNDDTAGLGPAQISNEQAETQYGEGTGLRCYVLKALPR